MCYNEGVGGMMRNFFKNWNLFEICFFIGSLLALVLCFVFSADKNVFSFVASLIGVLSVITVAKGLVIAPFIDIVYNVLYAIISIFQGYYGELIIYTLIMIPISVMAIISWRKNRNKDNKDIVEVNTISLKEYIYLTIVMIVASVGFYFLLKALNTSELVVSLLAFVTSIVASYLMLRRCSYYAVGFILNDVTLIILWSFVVVNNGVGYLPTVISFFVFLINDVYGLIHWKVSERKQYKEKLEYNK